MRGDEKVLRFEVFGRRIDVERKDGEWVAYLPGDEGKRRLANIPISSELDADGIGEVATMDGVNHPSDRETVPRS